MPVYYGVHRSDDYLAHYGIKGMKWGVRKAIERGDKKALHKHWDKAHKKLHNLQKSANLVEQRIDRRNNAKLAGVGAGVLGAGALANKLSKGKIGPTYSGITGTGLLGVGAISGISNHMKLGAKGHAKAVKKVNEWQDAMYETFKDTKYKPAKPKKYKDEYSIVTYSSTDSKGNPKKLMSINGSHLTRNYKGEDKKRFENLLKSSNLNSIKSPKLYRNSTMSGWETNYEEYSGRKKKRS